MCALVPSVPRVEYRHGRRRGMLPDIGDARRRELFLKKQLAHPQAKLPASEIDGARCKKRFNGRFRCRRRAKHAECGIHLAVGHSETGAPRDQHGSSTGQQTREDLWSVPRGDIRATDRC